MPNDVTLQVPNPRCANERQPPSEEKLFFVCVLLCWPKICQDVFDCEEDRDLMLAKIGDGLEALIQKTDQYAERVSLASLSLAPSTSQACVHRSIHARTYWQRNFGSSI